MKTLDSVLIEQKRSRAVAVDALAQAAIAPARVDSRATPRSARDPLNRYDPAKPDRDPHTSTLQDTTVKPDELPDPTAEQQAVLNRLSAADAKRFRQQFGLRPLAV